MKRLIKATALLFLVLLACKSIAPAVETPTTKVIEPAPITVTQIPKAILPTNTEAPIAVPTNPDAPIDTPIPTNTLTPIDTPTPTDTPYPTNTPLPILLSGHGRTATDPISLPSVYSKVTFTHNGSSNFIVTAFFGNDQELLVNKIGNYLGTLFLNTDKPVMFDIEADGDWTANIEGIGRADSATFSGTGDNVSGMFDPPSPGAWEISHDGKSNFVVYFHCIGGSDLIINEIGVFSGSTIISFDDGPCLWIVNADGNWSIKPR
jgi:hypothetical protein